MAKKEQYNKPTKKYPYGSVTVDYEGKPKTMALGWGDGTAGKKRVETANKSYTKSKVDSFRKSEVSGQSRKK